MAIEVVSMPKAGEMMEEGMVVEWLVEEGEVIAASQPIAVIETDKADFDLESPWEGRIVHLLVDVDERLPVGEPLCEIETTGP